MTLTIQERKRSYLTEIYAELHNRGIAKEDIQRVINKTGFMSALEDYPEEQMHYSVKDAVNEILVVAASE